MVVQVIEIGGATKTPNPLNPFGPENRNQLHQDLKHAQLDPNVTSIVLKGQGHTFSAGADLVELSMLERLSKQQLQEGKKTETIISLMELCNFIEAFPKPIVAAIEGVALGGGCEVALASHYRIVAATGVQMGLPEVNVGVIPGAGGTQRLPRLIGLQNALDMICTGRPLGDMNKALTMGLIDAVCPPKTSIVDCAKAWAEWAELMPIPRVSHQILKETPTQAYQVCRAASLKYPPVSKGGDCIQAAITAIQASVIPSFSQGMEQESSQFWKMCLSSVQGKARRHGFFAVRTASKSTYPKDIQMEFATKYQTSSPLLRKGSNCEVGVIGAGTMGSGIAMVLLQSGFTVSLVDVQEGALKKGIKFIHTTMNTQVKKKRLSSAQVTSMKQRLKFTQSLQDLSNCKLVVEAVVENMTIKKKILTTLDQVTPSDAILLSNTSTLDMDEMASVLGPSRRGNFAGWHFFSPAYVMKLVEIIVGKYTSPHTVLLLQKLTKKIKKIGVVVGNCDGFVGNRMVNPYTTEMTLLLAEGGATIDSIDKALMRFGMAIGPFMMSDLAGNDVGYFIRKERGVVRDPETGKVGPNRTSTLRYTELGDDMVTQLGRVGQKAGKGWYDYAPHIGKGRMPLPSTEMKGFLKAYVKETKQKPMKPDEIVERILFPLVNEGFKILEENIASKPSDIDVVYLYGYGWPVWRGGPMFWADNEIGLPNLLNRLLDFHRRYPGSKYYEPSRLLQKCVAFEVTVEEYYQRGMHKAGASKL